MSTFGGTKNQWQASHAVQAMRSIEKRHSAGADPGEDHIKDKVLADVDGPSSKHRCDLAIEQDSGVTTLATQTAPVPNQVSHEVGPAQAHNQKILSMRLRATQGSMFASDKERYKQKSESNIQTWNLRKACPTTWSGT